MIIFVLFIILIIIMNKKVFLFIIIFLLFTDNVFSFSKNQILQIENKIDSFEIIQDKIVFLDEIINISKNDDKEYFLKLKQKIVLSNLKEVLNQAQGDYLNNKYIYEKNFIVLKSVDPEASLSPYYAIKLINNIYKDELHFKSFVYLLNYLREKKSTDFIKNYKKELLNKLNDTYAQSKLLENQTFIFLKNNNYNYLSYNDLDKFKRYILKNNIWYDSKIFQHYVNYKSFHDSIIWGKIYLLDEFEQKLQLYNLSCEINSASLFASYLSWKEITENDIINKIQFYTGAPEKKWNKFYWWNPYEEFVWDIKWFQTKSIDKITWYWIYAKPINNAIRLNGVNSKVEKFDIDIIVKSLLNNKPVMFWYLSKNNSWNINTKPIFWHTSDNKKIYWYIWEHTWIIVWLSFLKNWNINKIYFYEGKNSDLQEISYQDIVYQASFFDMIIVWE